MSINQNPNLQYPHDVTPDSRCGVSRRLWEALKVRFPLGWTVGPMGGSWFAWDHLGTVVGMAGSQRECILAATSKSRPKIKAL